MEKQKMRLIVASNNANKLREFREILGEQPFSAFGGNKLGNRIQYRVGSLRPMAVRPLPGKKPCR